MRAELLSTSERHHEILDGETLFALGDLGRGELVRGELIKMSPTGHLHGLIEGNLFAALRAWLVERGVESGRVLVGEVGIYTHRDPDTVRGADVAYISAERFAQVESRSYLDVAPELVVEVLSPDDRWAVVMEKLGEYFDAGVRMVWLVDPKNRQIYVYRGPTSIKRFREGGELSAEDVLPGFRVAVSTLFAGS